MASMNKVFLMGNLTRDPELRYGAGGAGAGGAGASGGGAAICKLGLAINDQWRDNAGQQHEEVTFVDITVFGRQAETCNEYLKKGRPVLVEGRLSFRTWEDRESGQKRSKLDVVAMRVHFLGGSQRDGEGGGGGGYRGQRDAGAAAASAPASSAGAGSGGSAGGAPRGNPGSGAPGAAAGGRSSPQGEGVDFDDIPF
jgi:single-strand DNA-binding protein